MDTNNDLSPVLQQLLLVNSEMEAYQMLMSLVDADTAELALATKVRLAYANLAEAAELSDIACSYLGLDNCDLSSASNPDAAQSVRQKMEKHMETLALANHFRGYARLHRSKLPEVCTDQEHIDVLSGPVYKKAVDIEMQLQCFMDAPENPTQVEAAKAFLEALQAEHSNITTISPQALAADALLCAKIIAEEAEARMKRVKELLRDVN